MWLQALLLGSPLGFGTLGAPLIWEPWQDASPKVEVHYQPLQVLRSTEYVKSVYPKSTYYFPPSLSFMVSATGIYFIDFPFLFEPFDFSLKGLPLDLQPLCFLFRLKKMKVREVPLADPYFFSNCAGSLEHTSATRRDDLYHFTTIQGGSQFQPIPVSTTFSDS